MIILPESIIINAIGGAVEEVNSIKFFLQIYFVIVNSCVSGADGINSVIIITNTIAFNFSIIGLIKINSIKVIRKKIVVGSDLSIFGVQKFDSIIKISDVEVFNDNILFSINRDACASPITANNMIITVQADTVISKDRKSVV